MNFCAIPHWNGESAALGGGVVRRFDQPPEGMFADPDFNASTGIVQWLEPEGAELVVRATIVVSGSGPEARSALAAVFDTFVFKPR